MKKAFFTALMLVGVSLSASAQHDDLYFVPKKKTKTESAQTAVAEDKRRDILSNSLLSAASRSVMLTSCERRFLRWMTSLVRAICRA